MNILDLVVGKPIQTSDERAEQIGPAQGIPIFGLDALSSAAYGPEAALSLLIPLGLLGVRYILPISAAIIALLVIVYFSYRQTIAPQLMYNAVGSWLEGTMAAPPKVASSTELQEQLKLQNEVAQALKRQRFLHGALNIDTNEVLPVVLNQQVVDIAKQARNHATDLIEDFMIAANGVVARLLENVSSLRRIVKTPERWDRIVQLAAARGETLPAQPDSKALNDFLLKRKSADPDHFADLSLAVIKLIGPGEYVLERPGDPELGHFGLAVQDYTHSRAPNRRFADVVTQRLIKTFLAGASGPYSDDELAGIARNCTLKEDATRKVEREMSKRLAAVAMSSRIGETFDAIVTGVTPHGTFVRVMNPHIEGLLAQGTQGLDVGDKLRAKLTRTDVQRGYIDFSRV